MTEQAPLHTKEVIDRIFKEPGIQYELNEFQNLGKPIHEIITIYPKVVTTGKDAGKTKYFLKSFIPFSSGNDEVQVYVEGGKSAPEDAIPEAVADLIAETFSEPETEPEDVTNGNGNEDNGDDEVSVGIDDDPVALAEERLNDLKAALLKAKKRLMDLESNREALEKQKDQEIESRQLLEQAKYRVEQLIEEAACG
jgi:hypothetical protein